MTFAVAVMSTRKRKALIVFVAAVTFGGALAFVASVGDLASGGVAFLVRTAVASPHAAHPAPAGSPVAALGERRLEASLRGIEVALDRYPAGIELQPERRVALAKLDAIMQDPDASHRRAVQRFFRARIELAAAALAETQVADGARVWQIYNDGFVVRTPSVTLCFDLVRAKYLPGFALPTDVMERIVDACDVLFVSHAHADHAETFVAQAFIARGKPVVAPAQIGYAPAVYAKVVHLRRDVHLTQSLAVRNGSVVLDVVVYPGHQDDLDNNVVLVRTREGVTVVHTGDEWNAADFEWLDTIAREHRVDILLASGWTLDIARVVRGCDPAVVIPGHANELGHDIAKRQGWLASYDRKQGSAKFGGQPFRGYDQPLVVPAWGESYAYDTALRDRTRGAAVR